jgi:hypothetical protein
MGLAVVVVLLTAAPAKGVDGGLPLQDVTEVLGWRAAELTACLPAAKGLVRYEFGVGPRGNVERLAFKDSKGVEPRQITCVGTVLEQLHFPSADAGTTVEWAFTSGTSDAGVQIGRAHV